MLLLAGSQILCGYVYDAVGVDIEGNLNLRHASSCGRDSIQTELAQGLVVPRELTLALYDVDIYGCLVVGSGGEDLALSRRDRRVSLDQAGRDASLGLDGQGQRRYVQKQDVACACVACQLAALDGSADCHALIRVQGLAGLMAGQLFYLILYGRDTCGAAYQQHLSKLGGCDACVS